MSKQRSFIATLSFNGQPLNGFAESTRGPVVLETPGTLPATAVDGGQALGYLDGSESDFAHGQEMGLITFEKAPEPAPLRLYFRDSERGYRIYVRGGALHGQGVFVAQSGLVEISPVERHDPTCWQIDELNGGAPLDVLQQAGDTLRVTMTSEAGHNLYTQLLYPVGGFLACLPQAEPSCFGLTILEREVDWLSAS